jgi:hypothetical protein
MNDLFLLAGASYEAGQGQCDATAPVLSTKRSRRSGRDRFLLSVQRVSPGSRCLPSKEEEEESPFVRLLLSVEVA